MDAVSVSTTSLPSLVDNGRMSVKFDGAYFKQIKLIRSDNDNVINVYVVYQLDPISSTINTDYTVQNALFGGAKITKNATDNSKHKYEDYGICFDEGGEFSHTIKEGNFNHTTTARNVIIFGADMSFRSHTTTYVMDKPFIQGINGTTIYTEKKFYRNSTDPGKKFVFSLHYNGNNSYLFANGKQELKFKAKDDQIVKEILCLGNISDDWTTANAAKTGLYGTIYDFAVHYTETGVSDIFIDICIDIHRQCS